MALKDKSYSDSLKGGGLYWKPKEHSDALAFLIEYKGYNPDHVGYQNAIKPAVNFDITVFSDDLALQTGTPEVYKDQWNDNGAIVGWLKRQSVGDDFIKKLVQLPGDKGKQPAWAFAGVDTEEIYGKVVEYYENREKAVAEALSGDDVPPWMQQGK